MEKDNQGLPLPGRVTKAYKWFRIPHGHYAPPEHLADDVVMTSIAQLPSNWMTFYEKGHRVGLTHQGAPYFCFATEEDAISFLKSGWMIYTPDKALWLVEAEKLRPYNDLILWIGNVATEFPDTSIVFAHFWTSMHPDWHWKRGSTLMTTDPPPHTYAADAITPIELIGKSDEHSILNRLRRART